MTWLAAPVGLLLGQQACAEPARPLGRGEAEVDREPLAGGEHRPHGLLPARGDLGRDSPASPIVRPRMLEAGRPARPHERVVHEDDAQVGVDQGDRVGGVLDEGAEGGAAGAQAQLGVLAGGDVGGHHGHAARRRPRSAPAGHQPQVQPAQPLAGGHLQLELALAALRRPRPAARARGDRPPRAASPASPEVRPTSASAGRPTMASAALLACTWRRSRSSSRTMLSSSPGPAPDPRVPIRVTARVARRTRARYLSHPAGLAQAGGYGPGRPRRVWRIAQNCRCAGSGSSPRKSNVLRLHVASAATPLASNFPLRRHRIVRITSPRATGARTRIV